MKDFSGTVGHKGYVEYTKAQSRITTERYVLASAHDAAIAAKDREIEVLKGILRNLSVMVAAWNVMDSAAYAVARAALSESSTAVGESG